MFDRCDGLWSDEPGQAMMLLTADCLPVAIAREPTNGRRPAVAILHVGWRGLLGGIVAAGARALGGGRLAAAIGPGIGPCCYEVGPEVAEPFRAAYGGEVIEDAQPRPLDARRSGRCARPAARRSSGPTSAPPATPSSSSPTAATAA